MTQPAYNVKILRIYGLSLLLFVGLLSISCEREIDGPDDIIDTIDDGGEDITVGDGVFSVSEITKVEFAPGNLKDGGHGFTAHQYDYGGLFGWGTGDRPSITSTDNQDYPQFHDWGEYNTGGNWRTLMEDEWHYLLFRRENAMTKYGMGTVWGVQGMILLPDKWVPVPDCVFQPGFGWRKNVYNIEQWTKMEKAGAVFLPAAGYRWETTVSFVGIGGYYWVAPTDMGPLAQTNCIMCFGEDLVSIEGCDRAVGCSVRLVKDWNY